MMDFILVNALTKEHLINKEFRKEYIQRRTLALNSGVIKKEDELMILNNFIRKKLNEIFGYMLMDYGTVSGTIFLTERKLESFEAFNDDVRINGMLVIFTEVGYKEDFCIVD